MSERFKGLIAHNEDLERLTVKSIQDALAYLLEKKDFSPRLKHPNCAGRLTTARLQTPDD